MKQASAVITRDEVTPTRGMSFDLSPQTFEQAVTFSEILARSDLVPKDFKGKPENCLIAMQWGSELGLKALQSLQNIAVINGRPSIWGDAVLAIVIRSSVCEYVTETDDGDTATCRVKRKDKPEQVRTFSMADAATAGLASKAGPWTQYPKRMRQMRARAFALRDVFPDLLKGIPVAEEVMDTPVEKHMGAVVEPEQPETGTNTETGDDAPAANEFPQKKFTHNLAKWAKTIANGEKTLDGLREITRSKGEFTAAQEEELAIAIAQAKAELGDITDVVVKEKPEEGLHEQETAEFLRQHIAGSRSTAELSASFAENIGHIRTPALVDEMFGLFDARHASLKTTKE